MYSSIGIFMMIKLLYLTAFFFIFLGWCAFELIHTRDASNMMVSSCFQIKSEYFDSVKECHEWACSIQCNAINLASPGKCSAKRCKTHDPQLETYSSPYDVYFRK